MSVNSICVVLEKMEVDYTRRKSNDRTLVITAPTGSNLFLSIGMVQCEAERDSVWGLVFPTTVGGFSYSQQCPQNGTGTTLGIIIIHDCMCVDMHVCIGTATRFCTLGGVWEAVNIDDCTSEVISLLNDRVRLLQLL